MSREGADVLYMIENGREFVFQFYDSLDTYRLNRWQGLAFAAFLHRDQFMSGYTAFLVAAAFGYALTELVKAVM